MTVLTGCDTGVVLPIGRGETSLEQLESAIKQKIIFKRTGQLGGAPKQEKIRSSTVLSHL